MRKAMRDYNKAENQKEIVTGIEELYSSLSQYDWENNTWHLDNIKDPFLSAREKLRIANSRGNFSSQLKMFGEMLSSGGNSR